MRGSLKGYVTIFNIVKCMLVIHIGIKKAKLMVPFCFKLLLILIYAFINAYVWLQIAR